MNDTRLRDAVSGRTVLLTGATCGVTEAVGYHLSLAGAKVLVVGAPGAPGHEPVPTYRADPASPAAMRALAERVLDEHGHVDVLVHRTGRRTEPPPSCRDHAFQQAINTHYVGPTTLIRTLLPAMRFHGGAHLVHVSTADARVPAPLRWGAYRTSTAAFDVWFRGLAPQVHDRGVTTTSLYPGLLRAGADEPAPFWRRRVGLTPAQAVELIRDAITRRPRQIAPWWIGSTRP